MQWSFAVKQRITVVVPDNWLQPDAKFTWAAMVAASDGTELRAESGETLTEESAYRAARAWLDSATDDVMAAAQVRRAG